MDDLQTILDAVLPVSRILIPIGIGFFLRLVGLFGDTEGVVLRQFVVRFTVPVFVFFSVFEAPPDSIRAIGPMAGALPLVTAGLFVLGWFASRFVEGAPAKTAVHACCTFGNYGWMGLGVAQALLGPEGVLRALFFILPWWPVFYAFGLPIGLMHVGRRKGGVPWRHALAVAAAPLTALALGLACNLGSVRLPSLVAGAVKPFGDMTIPLILLSVGMMLDFSRVRAHLRPALLVSAVTLGVGPFIGAAVAALLTRDPVSARVMVIQAAMPVATLVPVLADSYEMDMDLANTAIVVSTALALVTIPVVSILSGF